MDLVHAYSILKNTGYNVVIVSYLAASPRHPFGAKLNLKEWLL